MIVSTDDDEIAAIARSVSGVEVPFKRPAHLASDTAGGPDVYLHVADWLSENEGVRPETLVSLLATAPLRRSSDVHGCISLFKNRSADVVMSVTHAKPAAWQQIMLDDGALRPVPGLNADIDNRQAFRRTVIPNGSVYVFDIEALRRTRTYFGPRSYGYMMPPIDLSISIIPMTCSLPRHCCDTEWLRDRSPLPRRFMRQRRTISVLMDRKRRANTSARFKPAIHFNHHDRLPLSTPALASLHTRHRLAHDQSEADAESSIARSAANSWKRQQTGRSNTSSFRLP